jgi:hypothetical protein
MLSRTGMSGGSARATPEFWLGQMALVQKSHWSMG